MADQDRSEMRDPLLFDVETDRAVGRLVADFREAYLAGIAARPVYPEIDRAALRAIMDAPLPRAGTPIEALMDELQAVVVANATHTAHPRFLPYVQPSPNSISAHADLIAATLNQNCNLWHLSPSANAVEQAVLGWFGGLFGFPDSASGVLTSGGSVANLVGLTAARDRALGVDGRRTGLQAGGAVLTAYCSDQTHSSIDKAISILGLGTDNLRHIGVDGDFRIDMRSLRAAIAADRAAGKRPFCIVANAGTVMTGAFDPIGALAELARAEGMWLHVDGAYGALTALSPRFAGALAAIGQADSVSLDPHKFLFCAFDVGCVLVRDRASLRHAFDARPSYLTMSDDADFIDFANQGPQLSRSFRALKVWWSIRHHGADAFAGVIDRMADLALLMEREVERRPAFELLAPVTFNCICFRLRALDDRGNLAALQALLDSGTAFLGPASVGGRAGLRACFMNLRTTEADVGLILDTLERIADRG